MKKKLLSILLCLVMVVGLLPTVAFAADTGKAIQLGTSGISDPTETTTSGVGKQVDEQFTLTPGGTYYFDLSGVGIPGTANGSLPDTSLHYVPFTYAGTVDAYKLASKMATTEEYAQENKYAHSLFMADYAVTHTISWDGLNEADLIFGKNCAAGGVDYTLRAPSVGSGDSGTPQSNEWDRILDKNDEYIKNWSKIYSWGQDTVSFSASDRAIRGYLSARYWNGNGATDPYPDLGFRPVLEVLNPGTLGPDGLKAVALDLGGGKLGNSSEDIQIIVKSGKTFAAPASDGLTRPVGNTDSYFMWLGSDGNLYAPGDTVPADVTKLTAQFAPSSHSVTITTDTLPDGKVGEAYSQTLTADGTTPITWSVSGALPDGLTLVGDTIKGTPSKAGDFKFTVKATNSAGSDTKELSITIAKAAPAEFTISVKTDGNGTASASPAKAAADTEITLTATPNKGYHFKEWEVISGGVTIKDEKFLMPNDNVEVKAIFEKDAPAPTEFIVTFDGNDGTPSVGSMTTTNQKLSSLPSASRSGSYSFDGWYTEKSGGTKITTDTVFHANTTVYAHWTYTGGGGGGYSYYTIKATAGAGGSISPSGDVSVREGRDQTFTITPDKGYAVANVKIDGKSIGAVKSYTFENVSRTHTIEVIFMKANGNPQTGVFVDVATGSYYEDAVDWAVENGITKGTDDTHFSPDGICTRAQAVTFLWRTAGSPEPETRTMPFTDVPVGSYYYDAVLWAVENGITKGTSDTTFSPNMTCSRAQIVAFLWRSEKSPAAGTANPFADVKSTAYYAGTVLWAVREDITKGTTSTTFSPDADCTRAQIVTFLWRCKK